MMNPFPPLSSPSWGTGHGSSTCAPRAGSSGCRTRCSWVRPTCRPASVTRGSVSLNLSLCKFSDLWIATCFDPDPTFSIWCRSNPDYDHLPSIFMLKNQQCQTVYKNFLGEVLFSFTFGWNGYQADPDSARDRQALDTNPDAAISVPDSDPDSYVLRPPVARSVIYLYGSGSDPAPVPNPEPSIKNQKRKKNLYCYCFVTSLWHCRMM